MPREFYNKKDEWRLKEAYTNEALGCARDRISFMRTQMTLIQQIEDRRVKKIMLLSARARSDALLFTTNKLSFNVGLHPRKTIDFWGFLLGHEIGHTFEFKIVQKPTGLKLEKIQHKALMLPQDQYEYNEDVCDLFSLFWISRGDIWRESQELLVDLYHYDFIKIY